MSVERKCLNCGTWNKDNDYCISCGEAVSPIIIENTREEAREKKRFRPPNKFDLFIVKWKNSKYWILRVIYKILYTIAFIFFAIASFFAWIAASPNG
jgi:methionyl-tRNA synthetase